MVYFFTTGPTCSDQVWGTILYSLYMLSSALMETDYGQGNHSLVKRHGDNLIQHKHSHLFLESVLNRSIGPVESPFLLSLCVQFYLFNKFVWQIYLTNSCALELFRHLQDSCALSCGTCRADLLGTQ